MPYSSIYVVVGLVIACMLLYFIGWLYNCLRTPRFSDVEIGMTNTNVVKNEAYFLSNRDEDHCDINQKPSKHHCTNQYCAVKLLMKLKRCISSAETNIYVAMFNFTNSELYDYILRAKRNLYSLHILVLVDRESCADGKNKRVDNLIKAGKIYCFFFIFIIVFKLTQNLLKLEWIFSLQ